MENQMTLEKLKTENPELFQEIFEQGRGAEITEGKGIEISRFNVLRKTCGEDYNLLIESFLNDMTLDTTAQERISKLEKTNSELKRSIDEHEARRMTDQQLKEKFAGSKKLRDEFSGVEAYIAAVRHAAR